MLQGELHIAIVAAESRVAVMAERDSSIALNMAQLEGPRR
jgi:hypothetical protein